MNSRIASALTCALWLCACSPVTPRGKPYRAAPTRDGEVSLDTRDGDGQDDGVTGSEQPAANGGSTSDHQEASASASDSPRQSDPAKTDGKPAAEKPQVESVVASSAFARLSHRQWALATQALLHLDDPPDVSSFSPDAATGTGFDNTGDRLEVSDALWFNYQTASEAVAAQVAGDAARLAKITPDKLPDDPHARAQAFVASLGKRAFRRPLSDDERDAYVNLFEQAGALFTGRDAFSAGAELTITALLQAPAFIYRIEQGKPPGDDGIADLTDGEIAARLSLMLWDTLPDDALTAQADAGHLHTPEQIAQQVERMLQSPLATDKLLEFHRQLLELTRYDTLHPAGLPADIGGMLRAETEHFLRGALVDRAGGFADLFTSSFSYVNATLAPLYGLSGDFNDEWKRVDLDPNQRAGLLTQLGFLISRSGETAPIQRGVFLNRKILCAMLPPPPMFQITKSSGTTRRERIDSLTGKGTCGEGCHARLINPAGFPLESFDDQGRFRSEDNGEQVDTAASYPFSDGVQDYDGAVAWSRVIASSAQAHECYVRHWLEFAFERRASDGDAPLVTHIAETSRKDGKSIRELLTLLLQSESVRRRRSEDP